MTMAFFGPFAVPFCGLVSLLWGLACQALGAGGGVTSGRGELSRGHIKGKVTALPLAQLSLALLGVKGNCPLPEAAP